MLNRSIVILILVAALLTSVVNGAEFEQSYRILDSEGESSTFLYDHGNFEIICRSSDPKANVSINNGYSIEHKIISNSPTGRAVHNVTLDINQIGKSYGCEPYYLFRREPFQIQNIHCDPFSVKPPNMTCKQGEVCFITADNTTKCGVLTDRDCFVGFNHRDMQDKLNSSLPINRFVCSKDNIVASEFGLCYAKSTSVNMTQIGGLATTNLACSLFESIQLNAKTVERDGLIADSLNPAQWKITIETKVNNSNDFAEAECLLTHPIHKTVSTFKSNRSPLLTYNASERRNFTLPSKLQLCCAVRDMDGNAKDLSTFVLVYSRDATFDGDKFMLESKDNDPHKTKLVCKCSVPSDLFCRVAWEHLELPTRHSSSDIPKSRDVLTKHIYKTDNSTIHCCYGIVYVIQHPFSYKPVELVGLRWNSSITIEALESTTTSTTTAQITTTATTPTTPTTTTTTSTSTATATEEVISRSILLNHFAIPLYRTISYADGKPHGNYLTTWNPASTITATYHIYSPSNPLPGTVPLYEYTKHFVRPNIIHDHHFYTTNPNEIGTIMKGEIGKYGYRFREIIGYCFQKPGPDSEPLYAGRIPGQHSLFYSTRLEEISGKYNIKNPTIVCHLPKY